MNTTKINEWLQIIGMFGVIASLLFVGLQMKQAQEIALSATYQARTATSVDLSVGSINSPEYLSGMAKVYTNTTESLTMQEYIALVWEFASLMSLFENNHLQYELGFLPEEHWQRNVNSMKCIFEIPFYRTRLSNSKLRETFATVVVDIVQQSIENPSGCGMLELSFPVEK